MISCARRCEARKCFREISSSGTVKVLEGGIKDCSLLIDVHAYVVKLAEKRSFKQFFSQAAIAQYIAQTGYVVNAPHSDPYFVKAVGLEALEENIPTNEIFKNQYAEKIE